MISVTEYEGTVDVSVSFRNGKTIVTVKEEQEQKEHEKGISETEKDEKNIDTKTLKEGLSELEHEKSEDRSKVLKTSMGLDETNAENVIVKGSKKKMGKFDVFTSFDTVDNKDAFLDFELDKSDTEKLALRFGNDYNSFVSEILRIEDKRRVYLSEYDDIVLTGQEQEYYTSSCDNIQNEYACLFLKAIYSSKSYSVPYYDKIVISTSGGGLYGVECIKKAIVQAILTLNLDDNRSKKGFGEFIMYMLSRRETWVLDFVYSKMFEFDCALVFKYVYLNLNSFTDVDRSYTHRNKNLHLLGHDISMCLIRMNHIDTPKNMVRVFEEQYKGWEKEGRYKDEREQILQDIVECYLSFVDSVTKETFIKHSEREQKKRELRSGRVKGGESKSKEVDEKE